MTHRFAELTTAQAAALLAGPRTPVLLLPVGAIEPHGPHAPLETDPIISAGMCARAAERLAGSPDVRVLILPPLPYGVTEFGVGFAGAVGIGADTLHALVVEICSTLASQGFRNVVIVNNHFEPGQVATLRRAVDTLAARGVRTGYLDLVRRSVASRLTEEFRSGSCHAGRYETSLVLADRPDLVDTTAMSALPALSVDMPAAMAAGHASFTALGMDRAYCGAPAEATAEEGHATFATLTALLLDVIHDQVS
ncbi:creatininase family protein [Actinokineospora enzanensis]|uniref:creatininase family protein n=1 Tax=Actinokineospora enzanensis TaxID=155975 RepID=UPI00036C0D0B|nr:creatininase family protein [Actinokineospora enzanensis]